MDMSNTPALDAQRKSLFSAAGDLGAAEASGKDAKANLALLVCRGAYDGVIDDKDTSDIYARYLERQSKRAVHEHTAGGVKANVSKLTQVIKLGMLPAIDGPALLNKVIDTREALRQGEDKIRAAFDTFVDVARLQLKTPDIELADSVIRDLCIKPEAAAKDLLAKLAEDYKRLNKRHEEYPSAALEAAIHAVGDAIHEAGGELPAVTKEQKAKVAFVAKARAMGATVTF